MNDNLWLIGRSISIDEVEVERSFKHEQGQANEGSKRHDLPIQHILNTQMKKFYELSNLTKRT